MALGAMASNPDLRLKIVPVGLSYFHAHKFRSRAVVEFGAPLDIPAELVSQFSQGGKDKRAACGQLLDIIYEALKTVTLRTPDFETLMVRLFSGKSRSLCEQVCALLTALLIVHPPLDPRPLPQVIQAARRLYKSPGQSLSLGQIVELNKRFIEGYLHYQVRPVAAREEGGG
jgi:glycerol-3-phosphate O-acyltransferase/dihydroxyacetone phosphate acyltransferase